MDKPRSLDLREGVIGFVEGGGSRQEVAGHFGVSASRAIKLMDRWDRTGSAAPGKRGGGGGKLKPHKGFQLARVKEKPDIKMPVLTYVLKTETGTEAPLGACRAF
jgi:transposase